MMERKEYPILEYDGSREAIIEPSRIIERMEVPDHCVLTFHSEVISDLRQSRRLRMITELRSEMGAIPLYELTWRDTSLAVMQAGVGAPLAVGLLEELIALGCRRFVACGSAGVLNSELVRGSVVIPNAAVRDEGTSYHYVEPSREIRVPEDVVTKLESVVLRHRVPYVIGKTWTTDAFYRETTGKRALRESEGCVVVDMECSAFLAAARFRDVTFGQYFGAADDISGKEWEWRYCDETASHREKLFWLSVEACLLL